MRQLLLQHIVAETGLWKEISQQSAILGYDGCFEVYHMLLFAQPTKQHRNDNSTFTSLPATLLSQLPTT